MSSASISVRRISGGRAQLSDRYLLPEGRVFLSGVQALVRVLLDQHRADVDAGLRTGTLVSGYQGSPLGSFDREIARLGSLAAEHEIVHRPAVNEELGATAVWGSQLATTLPGARYDGVVGVWYGKAPGVDRSADAIRHGNFVGTDPRGGVLALCGDDPACKSSTLPSASESLLAALRVPVIAPGSVQELLDLGRHAIACSRASGLWAALKVATAVADATATVEVGVSRVNPRMPELMWDGAPYVHRPSSHLLAPQSLEMERTLVEARLELARRYARLNDLNAITEAAPHARIGIVASGVAYQQLREVRRDLGIDRDEVRVLKVGMLHPLDAEIVCRFAQGLDEVLVVEEKGPFLETLIKDALYGAATPPVVVGKRDDRGEPLLPATGVLSVDLVAEAVGRRLLLRSDRPVVRARLDQIDAARRRPPVEIGATRAPYYCSGCPHSSSTRADDDALVGAGIGCHTMVMLNPTERGQVAGTTQMGGEGAQWIGAAPFLEPRHFVQNLGDGTLHHSGSLAVRAAVAAGLNVTYKILYNQAVAMTGGQAVQGALTVPALVRSLEAEGVRRVIVTTDDPARYRRVKLPPIAEVRGRVALAAAQRELAKTDGVTVLIHDQACATELRRLRKRGQAPEPPQRVVINERVCEGCGDCGTKSTCLSVEPVETEFGRKTRIHQSSCNKDFSCLQGDCPSFLTVIPPSAATSNRDVRTPGIDLPDPELRVSADDVRIRLVGIGGTGVVTVSQVLAMAALIDRKHAAGLDQTGLSQKAGPVTSDVRITTTAIDGGADTPAGGLDLLLGFDIVGAATKRHLELADTGRTVAVVSTSVVPTADMVLNTQAVAPDVAMARLAIDAATRAKDNVFVDAQELATSVFGDHMPANVILLGAAWQHGAIPLSLRALREAFRLNGAQVEANLAAFDWGRAVAAAPEQVAVLLHAPATPRQLDPAERALVGSVTPAGTELRRLLEVRVPDLVGWGGRRAAERYVEELRLVRAVEEACVPGSTTVSEAVAVGLHKLMAYKDEYEVARLHLEGLSQLPVGSRVRFHLHPPLLRALGLRRKLALGRWFVPGLRLLSHGRRLRGTVADPFGRTAMRRLERALPHEYIALVHDALERLTPDTLETVVAVAELPDLVRGYEEIKLAGVARFRQEAATLTARLAGRSGAGAAVSPPPEV